MNGAIIGLGVASILFLRFHEGLEDRDPMRADLRDLDGTPEAIRRLCDSAGIPGDWADFLVAKAWVESRWNPYSSRGVPPGQAPQVPEDKIRIGPNDAAAAKQAFERQRERGFFADLRWPVERYTFGTFGLWQIIPANGLVVAFGDTPYENLDPWSHYMPERQIAIAVAYNLSLQRRSSYKANPTWATLYAGWSRPGNMDDLSDPKVQAALARFADGLAAAGIPESFMGKRPSSEVPSPVEILERVGRL